MASDKDKIHIVLTKWHKYLIVTVIDIRYISNNFIYQHSLVLFRFDILGVQGIVKCAGHNDKKNFGSDCKNKYYSEGFVRSCGEKTTLLAIKVAASPDTQATTM